MLSSMESTSALPSDPSSELAAAEAARQRLAGSLRLPSWFHVWLGGAVTVQIWSAAYGLPDQTGPGIAVLAAGYVLFVAVAWWQVARFRRFNGVRVGGWVSRAVLGTSTWSSLAYCAGFGGAVWAAFVGQPWLAALAGAAGGAGYAVSAHLWWQAYRRDPGGHARGESRATLVLYGLVAVAGLVALVAGR
jgi:hypothetical protein